MLRLPRIMQNEKRVSPLSHAGASPPSQAQRKQKTTHRHPKILQRPILNPRRPHRPMLPPQPLLSGPLLLLRRLRHHEHESPSARRHRDVDLLRRDPEPTTSESGGEAFEVGAAARGEEGDEGFGGGEGEGRGEEGSGEGAEDGGDLGSDLLGEG